MYSCTVGNINESFVLVLHVGCKKSEILLLNFMIKHLNFKLCGECTDKEAYISYISSPQVLAKVCGFLQCQKITKTQPEIIYFLMDVHKLWWRWRVLGSYPKKKLVYASP